MRYDKIFLILISILLPDFCKSQLRSYDKDAVEKLYSIKDGAISNNGAFVIYTMENFPFNVNSLVVQSSFGSSKVLFEGVTAKAYFTDNSKNLVFLNGRDSLGIVELSNMSTQYIPNVKEFSLLNRATENDLILLSEVNGEKKLILASLKRKIKKTVDNVIRYVISAKGDYCAFLSESKSGSSIQQVLNILNVSTGSIKECWKGNGLENLVFDATGSELSFFVNLNGGSIWHYDVYNNSARKVAGDDLSKIDSGLHISGISSFSLDGQRIFLNLVENSHIDTPKNVASVDVWSYNDAKLQSQQLLELGPKSYMAVLNLMNNEIIRLQSQYDFIQPYDGTPNWILVNHKKGAFNENHWSSLSQDDLSVISTVTGEGQRIKLSYGTRISPTGKFITGYLVDSSDIYLYEIASKKYINLTQKIPIPNRDKHFDFPVNTYEKGLKIGGWLEHDEKLIVYDYYDVWLIDSKGIDLPICLTNGLGRINNISFNISGPGEIKLLKNHSTIILNAFNNITKQNGYYSIRLASNSNIKMLTMGDYVYEGNRRAPLGSTPAIKSLYSNTWLVKRSNSISPINYFVTKDFIKFTQLSNNKLDDHFNNVNPQLIQWKTSSGDTLQGIIYYPQDFDSIKKYPLIVNFYEKRSDELNSFNQPDVSRELINIPWFVSRGYIVCVPDINFKIGYPGQSALESITSVTDEMIKYKWVDSSLIGIQGYSFSGFLTNYIVSHTNRFKAAVAGASCCDIINLYNNIFERFMGISCQDFFEGGQMRMGGTLWEKTNLYIENSPILNASNITSPLLLINNKNDEIVPFLQGVEMFTALRRLKKRVWLLQYDDCGHHVNTPLSSWDYTKRMTQYFDFYLKGLSEPEWMSKGVPAILKNSSSQ